MSLDEQMKQFRLSSRELFNRDFRVAKPHDDDGWISVERFREVQKVLFQKLVTEPSGLENIEYGDLQSAISVELRADINVAPIMLNRDIDSGYWDHPLSEIPMGTILAFVSFFDWDQLSYHDNQYVRAQVIDWPQNPEVKGKHALIEYQYVRFVVSTKR